LIFFLKNYPRSTFFENGRKENPRTFSLQKKNAKLFSNNAKVLRQQGVPSADVEARYSPEVGGKVP
jgi:hypothetical protein